MNKELVTFQQSKLPKEHIEKLAKELNAPPRATFHRMGRHSPYSKDMAGFERERELYAAWLESLKPGDAVYYDWWSGWSGSRSFTTVKSRTKTGMIRLADDKLVEHTGRVKGESHYLQPYTEEYAIHDQRRKYLHRLNSFKFDHLTNEGLALVMSAIMKAEDMLPKPLDEPSEK